MTSIRQVVEGRQTQGVGEKIAYQVTTTPWGSNPSSPAARAYDLTDSGADVTATVLSGSASAAGDVVTAPILQNLTAGHLYRLDIQFQAGGNTFIAQVEVLGEV